MAARPIRQRLRWPSPLLPLDTACPDLGAADCRQDRFGFRELWIDGYSWRLNGVRVKLRGSYTNSGNFCDFGPGHPTWDIWQQEKRLEIYWASQTDQFRNYGLDVVRTNFNDSCDMADEVGLMMKKQTEYAGFCQPTFTFNDKFWAGGRDANLRQMNVAKNHPSVIYWEAGNETMWVQLFLGEVPRRFASHWQLEICKAMRNFDLQRRPIDWDADSDLFGKWETHSLHYPAKLLVYPDIPNSAWWGPWDGKTPVDYMFGPITLGKKPVNVGESFLAHPLLALPADDPHRRPGLRRMRQPGQGLGGPHPVFHRRLSRRGVHLHGHAAAAAAP